MTPGTISVDIIDDYLYIHWIYIRSEDPEIYTPIITGAFEKYIKNYRMNGYLNILLYVQIALSGICLYRIIRGPTIPDRMVGIDIFGILVVGICAIISIQTERSFILDIGIAWIILSFLGTLTLAKYLTGKKLNE